MREFVGVKSYMDVLYSRSLKREALMFTKIAIPNLHLIKSVAASGVFENSPEDEKNFIDEVLWLENKQIVIEPGNAESLRAKLSNSDYEKYKNWEEFVLDEMVRENTIQDIEAGDVSVMARAIYAAHLSTRYTAIQLREVDKVEACPVYHVPTFQERSPQHSKNDVIQIALNSLPVADESISWEQIIEYRSDPDSRSKFLALRHWMSEVARAEMPPAEVEEKLGYLIDQYQKHMRLHRMKTNVGTLETIVTTGAEFLGDLVSFKWGKAAEALFSLKRRQVALLEGEQSAPGNEVAYIVKARETFGNE